jgi:type IV pilus biogenesis protein CpaD/CtpE
MSRGIGPTDGTVFVPRRVVPCTAERAATVVSAYR